MNKQIKRIMAAVLTVCMLVPLASALPLAAAEDAFAQWKTDGWTRKTEDGTQSVTSPAGGLNRITLSGTTTGNVLTYEFFLHSVTSPVDANIGAIYTCPSGDMYFFEYNTVGMFTRLRRLGTDGSDAHLGLAKEFALNEGQWNRAEVAFEKDFVRWSINGKKVYEITNTGSDIMTGGIVMLQCYNTEGSFRNVKIESEQIEIVKPRQYDLEFKTADSVKDFTAENGSVAWNDGKLIYTLTGKGSTLVSPPISVEPGDTYAMLLPLRNTLLVRMKNNTSASEVRVSYTSVASPTYSEDKSAVFAVKPHSDYTTYFFNLSECKTVAGGYLYGFSIAPIGAESGSLSIEAVTFEREAARYDWAGTVDSCTATEEKVTVKGTLKPAYADKTVKLYETTVENESEALIPSQVIAEVKADGTAFTIEIPFVNGKINRLSSLFLAGVDDAKLSTRFKIENLSDFSENPYHFELPGYTVKVTDAQFGAKGDAFTNDTKAIQAAIDHVSAKGGGKVIVPGDDSTYGRRYIITNVKLKDNVELHLEAGSVLWQSPRAEDYDYEVAVGHDVSIPGINWTHAPVCHNYPLIQGFKAKNIKLTGEGVLRSIDPGSEPYTNIWTGCAKRIHVMPIGFYACENVEVTGIELRRTNVWHAFNFACKNVYYGDITMLEVTCASGDGISMGAGTENVVVDRCYLYSNDDAIVLFSSYNEPRGLVWWFPAPEADNSLRNVVVRNSNLLGGHGITFITWGTDNPDLSKQIITGINVYNNVLHGGGNAVGTWPDNPYYGKQPFDNLETTDYSPVQSVRIFNNVYRNKCDLECIQGTDIVTDNAIRSATNFRFGNFERGDRKNPTWTVGLSNWTVLETDGYKSGNVTAADDGKNHYGLISRAGGLAQGLWMNKGEHTFTLDTAVSKGEATLIVQDILTGKLLAEQAVAASSGFTKQTLKFTLEAGTAAYLGIRYKGEGEVKLDNADVTSVTFRPEQYFTETFEDPDTLHLNNSGFTVGQNGESGMAYVGGGASGFMTMTSGFTYKEFDIHFRVRYDACLSGVDANIGLSFLGADVNNGYNINYNPLRHELQARALTGGAQTDIQRITDRDLPVGKWVDMAIRVQNGKCLWYMNGEKLMEFDVKSANGGITFIAYNVNCAFDDLQIAKAGTTAITGDEVIVPETEPVTDPTTELETEPVTELITEPETEPVTELITETDTRPETDSAAETDTDPATDPDATAQAPDASDTTDAATGDSKSNGGCRSAMAGGALALLAAASAALTLRRKHEDGSDRS